MATDAFESKTVILSALELRYGPPGGDLFPAQVSFHLNRGESLVISGTNGTGKSLLLQVLLGLRKKRSGSLKQNYSSFSYLPQIQTAQFHLPYSLGDVASFSGTRRVLSPLLPEEKWSRSWNRASGGERQRALLARTLGTSSDLLVLDEPFNHLDSAAVALLKEILQQRMATKEAPALVLVAHGSQPDRWLPGKVVNLALDGEHCHEDFHV